MRKQIYCTVTVLLIVIFNILTLASCGEDEAVAYYGFAAEVEEVSFEFDSTNYSTTVHTSTRINLNSAPAPESYAYTLKFLDGEGNVLHEETVSKNGGLSTDSSLSVSETFRDITGKVESVRVIPYSITLSNDAMEEASSDGTFNFWYLIIGAAVIYFGFKIFTD